MPPAPPALKPPPIRGGMDDAVLRLKPYQYVHVLDNNKNVTRVITDESHSCRPARSVRPLVPPATRATARW